MKNKWDDYNEERKRAKKKEDTFNKCIDCKLIGNAVRRQKGYPFEGKKREVLVWKCDKHPKCFVTARSYGCKDWIANPDRSSRTDLPPAQ